MLSMLILAKGRYRAALAQGPNDLARAQALRYRSFLGQRGISGAEMRDADDFDPLCDHMLIEDISTGDLLCCYRLHAFAAGEALDSGYAGQAYGLAALQGFRGPKLELGRFCIAPEVQDPDVLRLAWGAMARIVDAQGVSLLFGCSSFAGCIWQNHTEALAALGAYLAPPQWAPSEKAEEIFRFAQALRGQPYDVKIALQNTPPLLRTYLGMGGWVSDHAVIDRSLDTLHVFTAVEIAKIPPARARALRAISA
jgi:L-ornithine Nalpha-acyltransferase